MKKVLSCVLVFALISVPLTSQVFANPTNPKQSISLTDDQKPLIKETDSKTDDQRPLIKETDSKKEMSKTKKVLIALSGFVALAAGIGFALHRGIENNILATPTTNKDISHEERHKNGNTLSPHCHEAFDKCFEDCFFDKTLGLHGSEKSFNVSYVEQMANDFISCFKPNCSSEDIQNNRAFFVPEFIRCGFIKTIDDEGKTVYDDEGYAITCKFNLN